MIKAEIHRVSESAPAPASSQEILRLAGDLDQETVVAVMATGATYGDIEEAVMWAEGDAEALGKSGHSLTGTAAMVYDLLIGDPGFLVDEER